METKGIIVSAFAGMGKTTAAKMYPDICIDLESSDYQWVQTETTKDDLQKEGMKGVSSRVKNENWPANYVRAIIDATDKYKVVFISMDVSVKSMLTDLGVKYVTVVPTKDRKDEIISGMKKRGNNETFINLIESNWDNWLNAVQPDNTKYPHIYLSADIYMDILLKETEGYITQFDRFKDFEVPYDDGIEFFYGLEDHIIS